MLGKLRKKEKRENWEFAAFSVLIFWDTACDFEQLAKVTSYQKRLLLQTLIQSQYAKSPRGTMGLMRWVEFLDLIFEKHTQSRLFETIGISDKGNVSHKYYE